MKYQDTWVNGALAESGYRDCANRYAVIRAFCAERLGRGFSVCDIGANMAYFSIRLIEDFDARAVAFEFHQYEKRAKAIAQNKTGSLMYLNRKLSLGDLRVMSGFARFDLVLALSVLHHTAGEPRAWIESMKRIARHVIIEFAGEDSERAAKKHGYAIPPGGETLAFFGSHLDKAARRPIIAYRGNYQ
jgi:SAM-dependent methyltransferase